MISLSLFLPLRLSLLLSLALSRSLPLSIPISLSALFVLSTLPLFPSLYVPRFLPLFARAAFFLFHWLPPAVAPSPISSLRPSVLASRLTDRPTD